MYLPDEKGTLTITLTLIEGDSLLDKRGPSFDQRKRKGTSVAPFLTISILFFDSIFSNTHSDIDRRLSISPIMKSFKEKLKEHSPV